MITKTFSIFDSKAQAFLPPFQMATTGLAHRAFADCVNNPEHNFGHHPEDYTIIELGEFDDSTGTFEIHKLPKSSLNGLHFVCDKNHSLTKTEKTGNEKTTLSDATSIQPSSES